MEKITKSSDKVLIDPNEPLILPDGTALVGRVEWFLYALCCLDYQNLPTPMSRIEEFANALITGEVPNIEPQSRAEQFFLAILDGNVSDLPQPQSRSEVLLDKLARGEFDLSDVEPIQSRYELLLAYLIKNGGIGNIDYVLYEFSEAMKTMYNTVEKPFKSLELSGNTLVNCVLEDTENDDYTSFDEDYSGTSFTINGTSEGAIKSAILSGQTLVNLAPKKIIEYTASSDWDGFNVLVQNSKKPNEHWRTLQDLKPNTKYYISCYVETFEDVNGRDYHFNNSNQNCLFVDFMKVNGVGHYQWISTTRSELTDEIFIALRCQNAYARGAIKIRDIMIIEYQEGMENWEIPYFTGMQSVKLPVLTTIGKNLFDGSAFYGSLNGGTGAINSNPNGTRLVTTNAIKLVANKPYSISAYDEDDSRITSVRELVIFSDKECTNRIGQWGNRITKATYTPNQDCYIRFTTLTVDNNDVEIRSDLNTIAIQIEQSSTSTTYEPYKTNILSCNEEVELCGIGDVKDTLDLTTNEVVERIGEIVLDGSDDENWSFNKSLGDGSFNQFVLSGKVQAKKVVRQTVLCDRLISVTVETVNNVIWLYDGATIVIQSSCASVNELKSWLQSNPITVQYELATPIIKTVDLNVVDQNNIKIDKIHVFDEVTHVNTSSDELTPTVNIGKSVSYPTIIKPNTKYTVDLKRNDKPLTVNLGGTEVTFVDGETRKTITTPSTLTNDKLSYYGVGSKCNEIMLIEGEIERNVDYFTGMQSVVMQNQMPILSTTGKNVFKLRQAEELAGWGSHDFELLDNGFSFNAKSGWNSVAYSFPNLKNKTVTVTANVLCNVISNDKEQGQRVGIGNYKYNPDNSIDVDNGHNNRMSFTFTVLDDGLIWFYGSSNPEGSQYGNSPVKWLFTDIQVEEGTQSTTYEPYKSSILSCNEDVTLRGIGDMKDELDVATGELTQHIGEIVLDGSENWVKYDNFVADNYSSFVATIPTLNNFYNNNASFISGDFATCSWNYYVGNIASEVVWNHDPNKIGIRVKSERASNVEEIKAFLSTNNIRINYIIATESIKTVDLNVVDQDGNTIPKIKSYKDVTHLEVTVPKQSLLPHISAEVATDNSKDMSSLTIKHQEISETQSTIKDNIQSQSDETDTALMATTEIFESILE